eukprot:TRINITY_DN19083_c0_g1_i1.p1 TRINITY_DN19083_c0_g1~~TRINITY_DN19083_c0_g1_i1.p1  ORF type:complete len:176 (-),score=9.04 TRINITY_DN19083_c0_g1_i1:64-543(-)
MGLAVFLTRLIEIFMIFQSPGRSPQMSDLHEWAQYFEDHYLHDFIPEEQDLVSAGVKLLGWRMHILRNWTLDLRPRLREIQAMQDERDLALRDSYGRLEQIQRKIELVDQEMKSLIEPGKEVHPRLEILSAKKKLIENEVSEIVKLLNNSTVNRFSCAP